MYSFSDSLGFLLFKKLFLIYVLVVGAFTSYEIYVQLELAEKSLHKEFELIKKSYNDNLGESVWNYDRKRTKQIADEIISNANIEKIIISQISGEVFLENKYKIDKNSLEKQEDLKKIDFEVFNKKNNKVAVLSIYYDKNIIYKMIEKNIVLTVVITLFKFLFLFMFLIYFIKKLIVKPLRSLIEATKHLDGRNRVFVDEVLHKNNKTELAQLTNSFNYMALRINQSFDEMTKLNVKLKQQKKELLQADKYKNYFLANISHELKTPLNPISLITAVMIKNKDNSLNEDNLNNIKIINKSANELKILINDILDLTKIESKDIKLYLKESNLKKVFNTLVSIYDSSANKKGLTFKSDYRLKENLYVIDEQRFTQVCRNLLSNAIKFTSKGEVKFNIFEDETNIFVEVIDTGIGISKKNQEEIFTSFKQLDGTTTRKYSGVGLGLAISKELVILQGGEIKIKSEEEKGSCFLFNIKKSDKTKIAKNENKEEKTEDTQILKLEKNKPKEEKDISVFILNDNPLLFFKVGVALNKEESMSLINIKSLKEFFKAHDKRKREFLIIHKVETNEELMKIKKENNLIIISIGKCNNSEVVDLILDEPIDNEYLIKYIKNNI
ncbi:sensor histidine kinase [Malaciobacter marinus]|uniref:sensor histidine kinase n=1 Tax=Malaciobacter marinus TaxID=505249 RepID=UPI003B00647F